MCVCVFVCAITLPVLTLELVLNQIYVHTVSPIVGLILFMVVKVCELLLYSGKYSWGPNFVLSVLSLLTHEMYVMMCGFSSVKWTE